MNFNKYKIIISGIVLGVLFWIIEAIMDTLVFCSEGDLIHHLFFMDAHELWMRSIVILFLEALSVYLQIIFNKANAKQQKIEASEKKSQDLANLLPQVICETDAKGNLIFVNQNAYNVFGYTQDDFDRGLNVFQMIVPNDHERVLRNVKKILDGEDINDIEYMALRKDGSIFPFSAYASRIIQENKSVGLRIVLINTSDLKKIEDELKESEEKYRLISESANDLIYIFNEKYKFEYINEQAFKKYLGYSKDELLGKSAVEYIHPSDLERTIKEIRKGSKKGKGSIELRIRHKNGTYRWLQTKGTLYIDKNEKLKSLLIGRDVTDKKQAEKKIRESEEKYRLISENANDLVAVLNSKFEHEYINEKAYQKILGYSNEDMLGKTRHDIIHPADTKRAFKVLKDGFKKGEVTDELRLRHRNGKYIWVETKGRTFKGSDGQLKALTVSRDITERKKAEQGLKESEEKYRNLVNDMRDAIGKMEADGEIVYASPQIFELTGFRPEEVIGKNWFKSYIHPEDFTQIAKAIKRTDSRGGFETFDFRWLHKDGHYIHVSGRGKMIKENGKIRYLASFRDITERKSTEQKLKASEVKYRHLFETSPNIIGLLNAEGILIDCNDAINDILSIHTTEDIKCINFKEIFSLNEMNKPIIPIFEKAINNIFEGVNQEGFDFRLNRAIGGDLWLHIEGTLIEIEGQRLIQFIMLDITKRKRSEQLLQESIEDLARINTELEQFTYVASHDLKEPLRMISSFAQLLERQYKDKLDENANNFIKFITEGVVRMQDLINSLLAYSRIGKLSKEFERVDINDVLKDTIDNLKQLINETNAEVIYDSLPSLFVDKNQLLQVLQNLISNAIKFHGKESPQVRVSARPDNQRWVFSIRDNGIGIDPKDFERIFIIFQRLHAKDEYGGTGIGLSICKKIVEQYGGKIWVESEVGKGSTFYFSIPKK